MTDEDQQNIKITPELAAVVRSMSSVWGMSNAAIGRRLGVPRETIRDIVNRKTWKVT